MCPDPASDLKKLPLRTAPRFARSHDSSAGSREEQGRGSAMEPWATKEEDRRAQTAAIDLLNQAGFVPDGKAWGRPRFVKPGSKRKVTVGVEKTTFYDVPTPGRTRMIAVVSTTNLERIGLLARE